MANVTSVYLQRENDKGVIQGFGLAKLSIDDMAGTLTMEGSGLFSGKWSVVMRPDQVTQFTIVMLDNVNEMAMMYGGGLVGIGIAALMSRWAKMPALRLEQPNAEIGHRFAVVRGVGWAARGATRKLMNNIADFLSQKGYKGTMPNLTDEQPWKFPWVPVAVGCGLAIAAVCAIMGVLIALGYYNN